MSFFNFIEQHNRIRFSSYGFGKLATFFVPDITWRRSNQPRNRMTFLVFRHINADHRPFIVKEELGKSTRELGFPHARRPQKEQHAVRLVVALLERAFVQAQALGDAKRSIPWLSSVSGC